MKFSICDFRFWIAGMLLAMELTCRGAVGGTVNTSPGVGAVQGSMTLPSFFGATNYFSTDLPTGHTNGPLTLFRQSGANNLTNLWMDVVLGLNSRLLLQASQVQGDGYFGGLYWTTDHDVPGVPSNSSSEFGMVSPRHIAFLAGSLNGLSGHFQIGNANGFGGYAGQGSGNNNWAFMTIQGPIAQASSTNFSGAFGFQTGESQGANFVSHTPAILAYSTRTNAPGRWNMMFTGELGQTTNALTETWDPNVAKPARWVEYTAGDQNYATMFVGTFTATNHASVGFNPDPTRGAMNYFPTNITSGVVLLNALTNMDTTGTRWFDFTVVCTNSHGSGGPFAIVMPPNVHTNTAGTVLQLTNVTYVRFSGIGGLFTNGFGQPQY